MDGDIGASHEIAIDTGLTITQLSNEVREKRNDLIEKKRVEIWRLTNKLSREVIKMQYPLHTSMVIKYNIKNK